MGNFISKAFKGHRTRLHEVQSDEEKQYVSNLQNRAKEGTIDVDYLQSTAGRTAQQQRDLQMSQTQGRMMQSGMQNSIVAQELARKTDRETLSGLAEDSRRIAMANEQSKLQAQDAIGEYGLMRSNRLQNISNANAEYRRQESAMRRAKFRKWAGVGLKAFGL